MGDEFRAIYRRRGPRDLSLFDSFQFQSMCPRLSVGPAGHYCDYGDEANAPNAVTGKCPEGLMSLNTGQFGAAHALRPIAAQAGKGCHQESYWRFCP